MRYQCHEIWLICLWLGCVSACSESTSGESAETETEIEFSEDLGSFVDLTLPLFEGEPFLEVIGLLAEDGSEPDKTGGVFGDLDGDGWPEVILGTFRYSDATLESRVYRYDRERQVLVDAPDLTAAIHVHTRGMVQGAFDVTGDGYLDLLTNDPKARVLPGNGVGGWGDPIPTPISPIGGDPKRKMGSVGLADLDQDGWVDILVADRSCFEGGRTIIPLIKTGPQSWTDFSDEFVPEAEPGRPFTVLAGPWGPGNSMMAVSIGEPCLNANPNLGFFQAVAPQEPWEIALSAFDPTPFESIYKTLPGVSWGPISLSEPMGGVISDIDENGVLDLLVTIKMVGSPLSNVPTVAMFQMDSNPFLDRSEWLDFMSPGSFLKGAPRRMTPWGLTTSDLDRDGHGDLVVLHGGTPESINPDLPERPSVLLNRGEKGFVEVTESVGLKMMGQWRALTVGDLELDGTVDLIVGGFGELPHLFRNDLVPEHHGIGLLLRGTTSNHLGLGAIIREVFADGTVGPPHLMGNMASPVTISEPIIFLGLGERESLEHIRILWPSGLEHEVFNLSAGTFHTIEEPPLFLVEPADRHLPADGMSEAHIIVTPRDEQGALREASEVKVSVVDGTGEVVLPIVQEGKTWTAKIRAPGEAGHAVVEVRIDGVSVKMRPRIWWDAP